jgi:hypothetical protein
MKLVHEFEELTLERRAFGRLSPDSYRAGPMSATEALGHFRSSLPLLKCGAELLL